MHPEGQGFWAPGCKLLSPLLCLSNTQDKEFFQNLKLWKENQKLKSSFLEITCGTGQSHRMEHPAAGPLCPPLAEVLGAFQEVQDPGLRWGAHVSSAGSILHRCVVCVSLGPGSLQARWDPQVGISLWRGWEWRLNGLGTPHGCIPIAEAEGIISGGGPGCPWGLTLCEQASPRTQGSYTKGTAAPNTCQGLGLPWASWAEPLSTSLWEPFQVPGTVKAGVQTRMQGLDVELGNRVWVQNWSTGLNQAQSLDPRKTQPHKAETWSVGDAGAHVTLWAL